MDEVHANFAARQRGLIRALTDGTPHRAIANRPPASARPARGSKSKGNDRPHRSRESDRPDPGRLTRDESITALDRSTDAEEFYAQCDPDKENLCLYGNPDGTWEVQLPAEEVPPELPEPALGINFARDGMQVRARRSFRAVSARARGRATARGTIPAFDIPPISTPSTGANVDSSEGEGGGREGRDETRREARERLTARVVRRTQRKDWFALVAVHSDAWLMAVAFYYGAKFDAKKRCARRRETRAGSNARAIGDAGLCSVDRCARGGGEMDCGRDENGD